MSALILSLPLSSAKAPFLRLCHGLDFLQSVSDLPRPFSKTLHVFAFDAKGDMLAIERGPSLDFIHGRMEWDDDTSLEAARREVHEQTGLCLQKPACAAVIETSATALMHAHLELVLCGTVDDPPFLSQEEERDAFQFVAPDDFLAHYSFGDGAFVRQVLDHAFAQWAAGEKGYSRSMVHCSG